LDQVVVIKPKVKMYNHKKSTRPTTTSPLKSKEQSEYGSSLQIN